MAVVVADTGTHIWQSDAADARVLEHADDGIRTFVRGADDLLTHSVVPSSPLLHALLKPATHHHLAQRVSLLCEGASRHHGNAHHVKIAIAHIV